MSKKKYDPVKALVKAFNNEVNDTELQENYDRFVRDLARLKEEHNKIIPQVNENLEKIHSLKDAIFKQAISGIIATEAVIKLKEIEADNEKYLANINIYLEKINKTATLIEKYEDWSTRKLFTWWQALKAVDPTIEEWLQWKETFKNKII